MIDAFSYVVMQSIWMVRFSVWIVSKCLIQSWYKAYLVFVNQLSIVLIQFQDVTQNQNANLNTQILCLARCITDIIVHGNSLSTTKILYNLSHYWDTAELFPLPDMHGAICAQAACVLILNSTVLGDML